MKKPEELEHGDLIEVNSSREFVELQKRLDDDLTYVIVGTEIEDGNTSRLAVCIHSLNDGTKFCDVMEWYVDEAVEKFDWLNKTDQVCEDCGNSYEEGTEKRCRSCRQDIEDQEVEEE